MIVRRSTWGQSATLVGLVFLLASVIALTLGCSDDDGVGPDNSASNTVTDIDGNVYQTIQVGDQVWMAQNLRVTHYRNGDSIPNVTDGTDWANLTSGAWSNYNNDTANLAHYGLLYNWYAVDDSREIAPVGWHVPSDSEWMALEMYLGVSEADAGAQGWRGTDEGGKLKEVDTLHWSAPNAGATDELGFGARPGGMHHENGIFQAVNTDAYFWASTTNGPDLGWYRSLGRSTALIFRANDGWRYGFSVRCIKDQ